MKAEALRSRIVGEGEEVADQLLANPANWRAHGAGQQASLDAAIERLGWIQRVVVNVTTGHLVDGHLRVMLAMKRNEQKVPVLYVELTPEEEAYALATLDPIAAMAEADASKLTTLLSSLGAVDDALTHVLNETAQMAGAAFTADGLEDLALPSGTLVRPKTKPDVIFTFSQSDGACCTAVDAGLLYGTRSTKSTPCERHRSEFVDNEWKGYEHDVHVGVVEQLRPRYATVLDLLTRGQCEALGLPYKTFDEIMRYAEDVEPFTENVIVIPKYDCIADIPKKYMLGYSVPSSYGGTPLAFDRFKGRRTHLLGGSPAKQFALWCGFPDEVISIDTNYIHKVAQYGQVASTDLGRQYGIVSDPMPALKTTSIMDMGILNSANHLYIAFAMSASLLAGLFDPNFVPKGKQS
jgi:hypothetical protein